MNKFILIAYLLIAIVFPIGAIDRVATQFMLLNMLNLVLLPSVFYLKIKEKETNFKISLLEILFLILTILGFASYFLAENKTEVLVMGFQILNYLSAAIVINFYIKRHVLKADNIINFFILMLLAEVIFIISSYAFNSFQTGSLAFSRNMYFKGFYSNINITAFSVVLKLPFIFFKLFKNYNFLGRLKYYVIILLSFFSLILLNSRGAYLAAILSLLIFISFYYKTIKSLFRQLVGLSIIIIITAFFSSKFSSINVIDRLSTVNISNPTNDDSIFQRFTYYENAFSSILEHPLGIGLGNWKLYGTKYAKEIIDGFTIPYHVHNDFLEIGAELGIIGFVIYAFFPILIIFSFFRMNKFNKYSNVFFASFIVFLIDSILNFPFSRVGIMIQVIFIILILEDYIFKKNRYIRNNSTKKIGIVGIVIFTSLLIAQISNYKTYKSFIYQNDLLSDYNSNNFKRDINFIENIPTYPSITATTFPVKALKANYYYNLKEYKKSLTLLNETNSSNLGFKEITKSRIFYDLKQYDSSYHYSKIALDKLPNNSLHFLIFTLNAEIKKDTNELRKRYNDINRLKDTLQLNFYLKALINSGAKFNKNEITLANNFFDKSKDIQIKNYVMEFKYGKNKKRYLDSLYFLAESDFQNKNYVGAISNYKDILSIIQYKESAIFENLGLSQYLNNEYENAIVNFNVVIDSFNVNTGNAELYKALALHKLEKKQEACDLLFKSERLGNKKARTLRNTLCK